MNLSFLKHRLARIPMLRNLVKRRRQAHCRRQWRRLVAGSDGLRCAERGTAAGPEILIATSVGLHLAGVVTESLLAAALTLRGARVRVLLCDGVLPACLECMLGISMSAAAMASDGPRKRLCRGCFSPAAAVFRTLGVQVFRYSEFLDEEDHQLAADMAAAVGDNPAAVQALQWEGLAVGEHALAGALRFFARGDLEGEIHGPAVLRRYLEAALLTAFAVRRFLHRHPVRRAVFHHGIYVPQGVIGEVCRRQGVGVVNWNPAYRKGCFIFSHGDTYHHTLMHEDPATWSDLPWNARMEKTIMDYLRSRWRGTQDWIWFQENPREDFLRIAGEMGLDPAKPIIGLLTNVIWDAQLHYPANAFRDMREWLLETIAYFAGRSDLQLLIRIHPAEIRGTIPSRQPVAREIARAFPRLPDNVFVIPADSPTSTYAAMVACNAVIIYGTKTGVELTALGIPVIVAGEAWIRNKGLTMDARHRGEYFRWLDALPLPSRMGTEQIRQARRYAYHFFLRRMIPLEGIIPAAGNPPFAVGLSSLHSLQPGNSRGIDVVCRGILQGTEFTYPREDDP